MRKSNVLLLIITLFIAITPVKGSQNGDITGSFSTTGYNNETMISDSVGLFYVNESNYLTNGISTSSITPQLQYYISFQASDLDGFENVGFDIFLIYYEGFDLDVTENELYSFVDSKEQTRLDTLYLKWEGVYVDGNYSDDNFTLQNDGATTNWEINPSITVDESPVVLESISTGSETSREFKVYFSVEKVAPYSSSGEWQVVVKAKDSLINTTTPDNTYESLNFLTMQFYGEINLDSINTLEWNDVSPGMSYDDDNAKSSINDVKFLSNSNYDILVKSSEVWTQIVGDISTDAKITNNAILPNTVSIVASLNGTWESNFVNVGQVDFTNSKAISEDNIRTGVEYELKNIYLYLKLSPQFQNGQYRGTFTIGISNSL